MSWPFGGLLSVLILGLALLLGAVPAVAEIPTTVRDPYLAPEDKALLVFARNPKWEMPAVIYTVVDEGGRCLGVLGDAWTVAAPLNPGKQTLEVLTGTAQMGMQLLRVEVEAGKTYVIRLHPRVRGGSEGLRLEVVRRLAEPFPPDILRTTPFRSLAAIPMSPWSDLDECSAWMRKKRGKRESKAKRAREDWNASDQAFRDARTVRPEDGYPASEVAGP